MKLNGRTRLGVVLATAGVALAWTCLAPTSDAAITPAQPRVSLAWVTVGAPGNAPDTEVMAADRTTGYGAVPYTFDIAKFLITNAQYAAFLNAVAHESDPYLLY